MLPIFLACSLQFCHGMSPEQQQRKNQIEQEFNTIITQPLTDANMQKILQLTNNAEQETFLVTEGNMIEQLVKKIAASPGRTEKAYDVLDALQKRLQEKKNLAQNPINKNRYQNLINTCEQTITQKPKPVKTQYKPQTPPLSSSELASINTIVALHTYDRGLEFYIRRDGYLNNSKQQFNQYIKNVQYDAQNYLPVNDLGVRIINDIPLNMLEQSFAQNRADILQIPALIQKISDNDATNYCGYYAAFNTWCFANNYNHIDRDLFAAHFRTMLQIIQNERRNMQLDNLEDTEIEMLLEKTFNIQPRTYICLGNKNQVIMPTGTTSNWYQDAGQRIPLLEAFKQKAVNQLLVLYYIGEHWVAINIKRNGQGKINFIVADSLNTVNWQAEEIIKDRLLPLYNYIR